MSEEEREHSLSPKGLECRYLGVDDQSKNGHIVWIPELGRTKRSVNCVFQEDINFEEENRDLSRFKTLHYDKEAETIQDDPMFLIYLLHRKYQKEIYIGETLIMIIPIIPNVQILNQL